MCTPETAVIVDLYLADRRAEIIDLMRQAPLSVFLSVVYSKCIVGRFYQHFLIVKPAFDDVSAAVGGQIDYFFVPDFRRQGTSPYKDLIVNVFNIPYL